MPQALRAPNEPELLRACEVLVLCAQEEPAPRGGQPSGPTLEEVFSCAEGICEEGTRVLNFEQRQAVASVLCGAGGRTPFALFGPPGTGKTVTLVECALQVGYFVVIIRYPRIQKSSVFGLDLNIATRAGSCIVLGNLEIQAPEDAGAL